MMYKKMFIYVANQIMESEGRVWPFKSLCSCGQSGRACSVQLLF